MRFHHIGIACEDIEDTIAFVKKSFEIVNSTPIIFDKNQNVDLSLLTTQDGSHIELVSGETVDKFVAKKQFLYHTCWEVGNLQATIEKLYQNGAMLILAPKPAILFENRKVAFLFCQLGIIELLENK
jgi:methylmalonyl-CoA/ethylmalonyl-CoA epimerase